MLLPLSKILDTPGASVSFSVCVDLSDLRFGSSFPVTEPVRAAGTVRNTAGVLILTGSVQTTLHGVCDRCASEFSREVSYPIRVTLVSELADEQDEDDAVFQLVGDSADLDDIVRTVFVLSMDSKQLCRPDCRGLCCRCGANLNDGPCRCVPEPDARLAILQQLLEKK